MTSSPRAYLIAFAITIVVLVVSIPLVNVIVDPFARYGLVNIPGFNSQKVDFSREARMAKPQVVCRKQPAKIILGTSRAEISLDPAAPALVEPGAYAYNLALAGSGLKEIDLLIQHAYWADPNLRDIFIGVDFLMFNANREATVFGTEVFGFDENRLLVDNSQTCFDKFLYDWPSYLGTKGLLHAWRTVTSQMAEAEKADVTAQTLGAWKSLYNDDGFRHDFDAVDFFIPKYGVRTYMGTRAEAGYLQTVWRPSPTYRYCFDAPGQPNTLDRFRGIVRFAMEKHLNLYLMINPIHARMLLSIKDGGLWPQYEEWKRAVVRIVDEEREGAQSKLSLWDFSGFNSITEEPIPALEDKTTLMRWFWDPSHAKKEAGDIMFARTLGTPHLLIDRFPNFGIELSKDNIESWIVRTRRSMASYERRFPEEARIISDAADRVLEHSMGSNCGFDEAKLIEGATALASGDEAAATAAFARATAIHERDKARYAAIGVPFREDGFYENLDRAKSGLDVGITIATFRGYERRGRERLAKADFEGAASDFSQALALSPRRSDALLLLRGTALLRSGQPVQAAADFRDILDHALDNTSIAARTSATLTALRGLAEASAAAGQDDEALQYYADVIAMAPATIWAYTGRARIYERLGRSEAADEYLLALSIEPESPALWRQYGLLLRNTGELEKAIAAWTNGLELEPDSVGLLLLRAASLLQTEQPDAARADIEAALASAPENLSALKALAEFNFAQGQFDDAAQLYDKALSLAPDTIWAYVGRANVYDQLGRADDAKADRDKVKAVRAALQP